MAQTKAFLIDPKTKTVTPVTFDGLADIRRLLGCHLIDAARLCDGGVVYVDDEGLYRETLYLFAVADYPGPLAGRGLLVGPVDDEGGDTDADPAIAETIRWLV